MDALHEAGLLMKPLGPRRSEPGPSARESWSLAISLAMAAIGCALGVDAFHKAGAIDNEFYMAALVLVIAVPLGAIISVVQERRANMQAHKRTVRTSHLYRIHMDWPPAARAHKDGDRVSRKSGRRLRPVPSRRW